jgi:hypothetical protein
MKKILTLLISKALVIAVLLLWNRVFFLNITGVSTIEVFNPILSDTFDRETRFKKANDIWWFCKNNLDKLGACQFSPVLVSLFNYLKNWSPGLFLKALNDSRVYGCSE